MPRRNAPPWRSPSEPSKRSRKSERAVKAVRLPHWRADGRPKVRFTTEAEANKAAFAYKLEHGADLNVYECEYCGGWHLGGLSEA